MAKPAPIREPDFDPVLGDIRHIIDIGTRVKQETREPKTATGWYASSLGYCLRRQFLERAGVPSTRDDMPARTLWLGDVIEHAIIARIRQSGLLIAEQVHIVTEEHQASGYLDFIFGGVPYDEEPGEVSEQWARYLRTYKDRVREAYPDGVPITGVECKSAAQYSAEKMFSEGPAFHHAMQAAFYDVFGKESSDWPENVPHPDRYQLLVVAKSDAKMLVNDVLETHRLRLRARLDELNECWPTQIPECSCGKQMSWEKTYCKYRTEDGRCCDIGLIEQAPADFWDLPAVKEAAKEAVNG